MILYHGSPIEFDKFDKQFLNSCTGWDSISKLGFCFTTSIELAKTFGCYIYQCEIDIKNPLVIEFFGADYGNFKLKNILIEPRLRCLGIINYDSIKIANCVDGGILIPASIKSDQYCVFDSNKIKIISRQFNSDASDEIIEKNVAMGMRIKEMIKHQQFFANFMKNYPHLKNGAL